METTQLTDIGIKASRIALGTWAIGGWMWGGTDEEESIRTIDAALDHGITVLDTAPVYGFGRSEEIVGKAIARRGGRDRIIIASKVAPLLSRTSHCASNLWRPLSRPAQWQNDASHAV